MVVSKILTQLKFLVIKLRKEGFYETLCCIIYIICEIYNERRLGIKTMHGVKLSELGFTNPDFVRYSPTEYYGFKKALKYLNIKQGEEVFLDLGSGKGRVLIMAAMFPFAKVIGIDVSEQLNAIAKDNIRHASKRLECKNIEIINAEAASYIIPNEVSVVYMYNPFKQDVLSQVFRNIYNSLVSKPRKLMLVCRNVNILQSVINGRPWLIRTAELQSLYGHNFVIYESKI